MWLRSWKGFHSRRLRNRIRAKVGQAETGIQPGKTDTDGERSFMTSMSIPSPLQRCMSELGRLSVPFVKKLETCLSRAYSPS